MTDATDHLDVARLQHLKTMRDEAFARCFQHTHPGNLTPAEQQAWEMDDRALWLMAEAADLRFQAALELNALLAHERAA